MSGAQQVILSMNIFYFSTMVLILNKEFILIFSTVKGMNNLSKSSTWYLDGNFSLAPTLFLQLYVIRGT